MTILGNLQRLGSPDEKKKQTKKKMTTTGCKKKKQNVVLDRVQLPVSHDD